MIDLFKPLSPAARQRFHDVYLAHEEQRNGAPDVVAKTLALREPMFAALEAEPVVWQGDALVDVERFNTHHVAGTLEPGLSRATLWALAVAKANCGERFGVDHIMTKRSANDDVHDPLVHTELEEYYHTRILRGVVATVGAEMQLLQPPATTRVVALAMTRAPRAVSEVVLFVAEIFGLCSFLKLAEEADALLASQPAVRAHTAKLFAQIISDEIGHVLFLRSRLGGVRLRAAQRILPRVTKRLLDDFPEADLLFTRAACLESVRTLDMDALAQRFSPSLWEAARDDVIEAARETEPLAA
jgi:hypothetical protein